MGNNKSLTHRHMLQDIKNNYIKRDLVFFFLE